MRVRALLLIPTLTAALLGAGVSSASAITLFTTSAHSARVTVGATADLTTPQPGVAFTAQGATFEFCPHGKLHTVLSENSPTRVTFTVTGSTLSTCVTSVYVGTHTPPWKLTVTGAGSVSGTSTRYFSTLHNVRLDRVGVDLFAGNLETGNAVTQPTVGTAPICLELQSATGLTNSLFAFSIDAKYCFTSGAAAWSLGS